MTRAAALCLLAACATPGAAAQEPDQPAAARRAAAGGGMGVSAVDASDLAAFVHGLTLRETADFKASVEFFGFLGVPVAERWRLKLAYAYLLGTFSPGTGEFSFAAHLPALLAQYSLAEEDRYDVRVGAGAGFSAGRFRVRYATLDDTYTADGPAMLFDLEATTALGETAFAYLGVDARWSFIGELRNSAEQTPPAVRGTPPPTLHFFSVGAKLGVAWYL